MQQVMLDDEIRLSSLGEPHLIETLDMDHLVDELAEGIPPAFLTPERLCMQNLVVVATEACSDRYLGLVGARDDVANGQEILCLDMACVAPKMRGRRLMTRLLARVAAERKRRSPILVARTTTPSWFRALRHFAARLDGAAFHPAPAGAVVALRTAAAARQIAATLYPEHRYDLATGVLHGRWAMPTRPLHRHASADACYEAARDPTLVLSDRLLAVIDLRGVRRAALLALARPAAAAG